MKLVSFTRLSTLLLVFYIITVTGCKKESINLAYPNGSSFKTLNIKGYSFAESKFENLENKLTLLNLGSFSSLSQPLNVAFKPTKTHNRFVFRNATGDILKQVAFNNNNRDTSIVFLNTGETVLVNPTLARPAVNNMGLLFGFTSHYSTYNGPVDLEFHLSDNSKDPLPAVAFVLSNIQPNKMSVKFDIPKPSNVVGTQYAKNPYVVFIRKAGTTETLPYTGNATNPNPTVVNSFKLVFGPNITKLYAIQDVRNSINYNINHQVEDVTGFITK
jgi:hypothetical protein